MSEAAHQGQMEQPPLRVVVVGGTGHMGSRVAQLLEEAGHEVKRVGSSTGVDALSSVGLTGAFAGQQVVVDALNYTTLSTRKAVAFFGRTAANIRDYARRAKVQHIVVLGIVNATDQAVSSAYGYYAGKAAQAAAYQSSTVPLTLAATTQWFTLPLDVLRRTKLGQRAFVPRMNTQAVAPEAAARFLAEIATAPAPAGYTVRQLAGPEPITVEAMAASLAAAQHPPVRVVPISLPGSAVLRGAGLLPRGEFDTDPVTFAQWQASRAAGGPEDGGPEHGRPEDGEASVMEPSMKQGNQHE